MSLSSVIRIPQADKPELFALLNISRNTQDSLDLTLEGTDGDFPYIGNVQQSRLSRLLAKNSDVSPAEWENLLLSKLFHRRHHTHETASDNVEVVAKVSVDQMRVVFRRNISGIHQRIGEIILNKGENHEINTISWISTAVIRSESLEQNVEELSKKLEAHEDAVEKLKNQLNELQQAKISDETALLDKFCEVLNYKKAKIRDQQNLLATAKVDKARAVQIQAVRASRVHHTPSPSRSRKRKSFHIESTSASDFERMDIDRNESDASEDVIVRSSSPDEVASDVSHDDLDSIATGPSLPHRDRTAASEQPNSLMEEAAVDTTLSDLNASSPPPVRELPFTRTEDSKPSAAAGRDVSPETGPGANEAGGEADDESSDDEL